MLYLTLCPVIIFIIIIQFSYERRTLYESRKNRKILSQLRNENNYTQDEIAEILNVNVKSVSRWENGKNLPDHSVILEICKIYNISVNEFYEGRKINKSKRIKQLLIFYFSVSLTGIIILPCLGLTAPAFIICAAIIPIFALVDLLSLIITGSDIPQITFYLGNLNLHPLVAFPVSVILAIVMFIIGMYIWKLLIKYIKYVSNKKKNLYTNN